MCYVKRSANFAGVGDVDATLAGAVVAGAVAVAGAKPLWTYLRDRHRERRETRAQDAELARVRRTHEAELAATQTMEIIRGWQQLAVASRERADALELRLSHVEAQLHSERARHEASEHSLRKALMNERNARVAAEAELDELRHRVSMLESYVQTHAQLSVEAVSRGLMRALAERAPRSDIASIVADVAAEMTRKDPET